MDIIPTKKRVVFRPKKLTQPSILERLNVRLFPKIQSGFIIAIIRKKIPTTIKKSPPNFGGIFNNELIIFMIKLVLVLKMDHLYK